ncbi:MAG: DUF6056 family protein [Candidatus Spyradenecus sp.]
MSTRQGFSLRCQGWLHLIPFILFSLIITVFTVLTPRMADDICYFFDFYRGVDLPIASEVSWSTFFSRPNLFSHLLSVTQIHYLGENGRFLTGFLLRLMAGLPQSVFIFCNSVIWGILCYTGWRLSRLPKKCCWGFVALWLVVCLQCDAVLWFSGAINYLWPFTLTLLLACFFLHPVLQHPLSPKTLWKIIFFPLGVLLAGGHELISITICLFLALYWLRTLCRHTFRINGALLLTIGYGVGALCIVFSPATLNRAGAGFFTPDIQLLYSVARKGCAYLRCAYINPLILLITGIAIGCLLKKSWRQRLDTTDTALLLIWGILLFVTCTLSDGQGRTGWCVVTLSFILGVRLLPKWIHPSTFTKNALLTISLLLSLATTSITGHTLLAQRKILATQIQSWRSSHENVMRAPQYHLPFTLTYFNRAWNINHAPIGWGVGEPWTNPVVARFYGKPACIALDTALYRNLYEKDLLCLPQNELPHCPGWFALPQHPFLVFPLSNESPAYPEGNRLLAAPTYRDKPPHLNVFTRLKKRLLREGYAPFSMLAPEQEMQQQTPLEGFTLHTPHGRYLVLRHNPAIPRESIETIVIQCSINK